MSSFDRRTFLLMPLALAACGFTPVYGPGGTGTALHGKIRVDAPDNQDSYYLVRNLEERFGPTTAPEYDLSFTVRTSEQGQAITAAGDITRYSIVGTVDFTLRRAADEAIIASGQVKNFAGYSATGLAVPIDPDDPSQGSLNASTVQTLAAERDARERLMVMLADQIATRVLATADLT
ncbi:LPS assembly lipoprotein LptE [Pontibaca salina]|uniref:LPS-assembly lipoprotein n=1 Tax=Pontibaca salina TaxID=2795731 RepID=A0A934HSC5_9RHOB|nr:LPS assembly lipoprotein LptE [Pontibaca salina]MBI6629655.1 hypothetical protein [Pontibaca salina]